MCFMLNRILRIVRIVNLNTRDTHNTSVLRSMSSGSRDVSVGRLH